jgi:hypothetical protein
MTIETASSKNKVAYIESWRVAFCKSDRLLVQLGFGHLHDIGLEGQPLFLARDVEPSVLLPTTMTKKTLNSGFVPRFVFHGSRPHCTVAVEENRERTKLNPSKSLIDS